MNRLKPFDILLLGQLVVDFHGEQVGSAIKKMMSYRPYASGDAAYALAFSRLRLITTLLSEIGDDPMGDFLQEKLGNENVSLSQLSINPSLTTALTLVGADSKTYQKAPLSEKVRLDPSFLIKSQALFLKSDLFQDENGHKLAKEALNCAKEYKCKVILVLENNHQVPQSILPLCSVIFIKEPRDALTTLKQIREVSNSLLILMQNESIGMYNDAISENWQDSLQKHQASHETAHIAFKAGFISAWLQQHPLTECMQVGLTCYHLAHCRPNNCGSLPTKVELTFYLSQKKTSIAPFSPSHYLEHLHFASIKPKVRKPYLVFNIGSLAQWIVWGKNHFTQDERKLNQAFSLIVQTLSHLADNAFTLMTDECVLTTSMQNFSQIIRSLDVPEVFPLQFKNDPDVRGTLISWPKNHHAKITLQYHPDDPFAVRKQQESILAFLYRAACATEHELWVEIVSPANSLITSGTLSHIIRRFYEIGIYPSIWQMTPPRDQRSWDSIERVIVENDPFCQGVVVSAQNILNAQLPFLLQSVAKQKYAKGFVLNRSILQPLLEAFFAEKIDEETFMLQLEEQFTAIAALWKKNIRQESFVKPVESVVS